MVFAHAGNVASISQRQHVKSQTVSPQGFTPCVSRPPQPRALPNPSSQTTSVSPPTCRAFPRNCYPDLHNGKGAAGATLPKTRVSARKGAHRASPTHSGSKLHSFRRQTWKKEITLLFLTLTSESLCFQTLARSHFSKSFRIHSCERSESTMISDRQSACVLGQIRRKQNQPTLERKCIPSAPKSVKRR